MAPTIEKVREFLGDSYTLDDWSDEMGDDCKGILRGHHALWVGKDEKGRMRWCVQGYTTYDDRDVGIFGAVEPGPVLLAVTPSRWASAVADFVKRALQAEMDDFLADFGGSLAEFAQADVDNALNMFEEYSAGWRRWVRSGEFGTHNSIHYIRGWKAAERASSRGARATENDAERAATEYVAEETARDDSRVLGDDGGPV